MATTNTALLGSTGMVGSYILTTLRAHPSIASIATITRRAPPSPENVKTKSYVNPDTTTWPAHLASLSPVPSFLISALATTRAAAGGFPAQYKLEHDLNIELAKTAKEAGVPTYVLISSNGASPNAYFAYTKMKGEIERDIKSLDFEHTVILRPGLIAGEREEKRVFEAGVRKVAWLAGKVSEAWLKDGWAQEAEVIARAAVKAGLMVESGEVKQKVWVLEGKDIVRLGRKEWSGE